MAFLECKIPENEPSLLFSEKGFSFFINGESFHFYPHLWIENGDSFSVTPFSQASKSETAESHFEINESFLQFKKVICSIDRSLLHPERTFHFSDILKKSLSDVISDYFECVHKVMNGAFKNAPYLNVIRPALYSREPSLEGLAIVRLKSALLRAGFPEKQKVMTVFDAAMLWGGIDDVKNEKTSLTYFTDSYSQFKVLKKEVGAARGFLDFRLFKPSDFSEEIKHPLISEALSELSHRSQLPFLKDSSYLLKASRSFSEFYHHEKILDLSELRKQCFDPYYEEKWEDWLKNLTDGQQLHFIS